MTITLTDTEHAVLLDFLGQLGDHMGNAGCNDYEVLATPENRQLLIDAYRANYPDATDPDDWMPSLQIYDGKYYCTNSVLLGYLRAKIKEVEAP